MSERLRGNVKRWNRGTGWGFISHPDGDVFVHYSAIVTPYNSKNLRRGGVVEFTLQPDNPKRSALEVWPVKRSTDDSTPESTSREDALSSTKCTGVGAQDTQAI